MFTKKVKVGGGVEKGLSSLAREFRRFRTELALASLKYINPLIGRGILGKRIEDITKRMIDKVSIRRKLNKIGSTKTGRSYINNIVISLVKKYGGEKIEINGIESLSKFKVKIVREELKKLYKNSNVKGVDYIENVRAIIFKHFDKETATKIDGEIMLRLLMCEVGKNGIVDLIDGRSFISKSSKPIIFKKFEGSKIHEALSLAKIRKTKKDYFDLKLGQIMLEAIRTSKSPSEASRRFKDLYEKALKEDPLFKSAEFEAVTKEFVRMYNLSAVVGALHETLTTVPSRLIALVSRLVAQAYRMLPIVGAIASAQVEAAGAVAEIGEAISRKVESSAYMYYSLNDVLGDKGLLLSRILSESKENQTAS